MQPDILRHLHAFHVVAERGGIRHACALLPRAPSTVTRAVASLERMLAVALFERQAQGMRLTAAGARILSRARSIEAQLAAVHAQATRSRLRIGPVAELGALFSERRLELAVLLADLGQMSHVARTSRVSQPAVSQAIARLEADLGQPLFLRSVAGMRLTSTGSRWAQRFACALDELRALKRELGASTHH